jgi:hypothetical protein
LGRKIDDTMKVVMVVLGVVAAALAQETNGKSTLHSIHRQASDTDSIHSKRPPLQPLRSTILWSQRRRVPLAHRIRNHLHTTHTFFGALLVDLKLGCQLNAFLVKLLQELYDYVSILVAFFDASVYFIGYKYYELGD